jgi:hypothetical protein
METSSTMSTGTKPVSRLQSRPLSSATITPSTPKPKKRPQTHVPPVPVFDNTHSTSSTATTPKPSAARQKLQDLFRIPLRRKSTSRSRSRSRPSSPQLSLADVPPLPTKDDTDTTPKPQRSSSPHIYQRTPSPTTPRPLRVTNATPSLASSAPSLKLPKFFPCKLNQRINFPVFLTS